MLSAISSLLGSSSAGNLGGFLSGVGGLASAFGLGGSKESNTNETIARFQATRPLTYLLNDAERHGIHPLFALGASTSGSSPSFVTGNDPTDAEKVGAVGRELERLAGRGTRQVLEDLGVREARARVRLSEADAEMGELELQSRKAAIAAAPLASAQAVEALARKPNKKVEVMPAQEVAKRASDKEAGDHAGFKNVEVAPGRTVEVPTQFQMDELGSPGMLLMLMRHYGMLKGYEDPETMTEQTHKQFKEWGYKPQRKRKLNGQMGRRSRW